MNGHRHRDPLAQLSDDLVAMEADIYGIAALGREIAVLFDAERRAAHERLLATVAAAAVFSALSATSAAIGFGHIGAGALVIGLFAGLAAASSALVTCPAPPCVSQVHASLRAWWRR
ncbi:hypothetical protein QLH51_13030 [Sphingomonas sp. 2R-10]|uniref:hypothetical protein n=1 Tax=Sphingomonas sp. 2R-10 TaxID=3045148 RepID=UPI000F77E486|nr:hypothetical protein [Sphingomonas sp. 2R-10]MDJ0277722.1 hypothetical protein [Sphingomonas sp. 2R-10]